jgi:hypothetical protein
MRRVFSKTAPMHKHKTAGQFQMPRLKKILQTAGSGVQAGKLPEGEGPLSLNGPLQPPK